MEALKASVEAGKRGEAVGKAEPPWPGSLAASLDARLVDWSEKLIERLRDQANVREMSLLTANQCRDLTSASDHGSTSERAMGPGLSPLAVVAVCIVCGWQPGTRKGRCNACGLFLMRHGRDKEIVEAQRGWELAIDKTFDMKNWR
jgi:hypothetical protein